MIESVTDVCARYSLSELFTDREAMFSDLRDGLADKATQFHLVLDDVSIISYDVSPVYVAAGEARGVASLVATMQHSMVKEAKSDKKTMIILAEGDAMCAKLIGTGNPSYMAWKRIEASRAIARSLASSPSMVYLDSKMLMLDLSDIGGVRGGGGGGRGAELCFGLG